MIAPKNEHVGRHLRRSGEGGGIDQNIIRGERPVRAQETGVDVLETLATTLKDHHRSTVIEEGDTRFFLIARGELVNPERSTGRIQARIQTPGTDAKTEAVNAIVLPDDPTAAAVDGRAGESLIAVQLTRNGILTPHGVGERNGPLSHEPCGQEQKQSVQDKAFPQVQHW